MSLPFYITDVFAEGPYAGNQLATIDKAGHLSTQEMQQIALAFNFAETTFITGGNQSDGFDVRIFTPAAELPFAGHPTLGTAFLIRQQLLAKRDAIKGAPSIITEVCLNLGVGPIHVTFQDDDVIWLLQPQPSFGEVLSSQQAAVSLGLQAQQIDDRFPVQWVSTGVDFLIVPVKSLADLTAIKVSQQPCADAILAFCPGAYAPGQTLAARMFAAAMGIVEDAATGSANGCLAAYLLEHDYLGGLDIDLKVGQGYEIKRPSQLYLRGAKTNEQPAEFSINVGGRVRLVAQGEWLA
ncbi:MAG: trans-2,3-dihydro-3-hydroxyanthranilate isomerase [Candidatus Pseudothioglobus sp.]